MLARPDVEARRHPGRRDDRRADRHRFQDLVLKAGSAQIGTTTTVAAAISGAIAGTEAASDTPGLVVSARTARAGRAPASRRSAAGIAERIQGEHVGQPARGVNVGE